MTQPSKEQEKPVTEGNKLIADFMRDYPGDTMLQYHSSWDWLMPVVQKIEHTFRPPNCKVEAFEINWSRSYPHKETSVWLSIMTKYNGIDSQYHRIRTQNKSKIEAVWQAVVEFIKWYNNQLKEAQP